MGTAKHIDFIPELKATTVKVPESVSLVVANSCTPSPKLLTLGTRYNKRVVECKWAVSVMALAAGVSEGFNSCPFATFQELQAKLNYTLDQMISLADTAFTRKGEWTVQMMTKDFGIEDPFDLVRDIPHIEEVQKKNASFHLYRRAHHVLTEAKRVESFKELCGADLDEEEKVTQLGAMMNESHFSCRDYYECSSE